MAGSQRSDRVASSPAVASAVLASMLFLLLIVVVGAMVLASGGGRSSLRGAIVSRVTQDCPVSKARVSLELLLPVDADRPVDVLSCSAFAKPYHVRCKKNCLAGHRRGR